jgi:serine protease Do
VVNLKRDAIFISRRQIMVRRTFSILNVFFFIILLTSLTACTIAYAPVSEPTGKNIPVAPIDPGWTLSTPTTQQPVLPNIADVVALVKPSVVAIDTEVVAYDFFNQPSIQQGAGSGWIIDGNGIIVTNNHVVEGARTITVTLSDGRTFEADEIRTDSFTDLAILKIQANNLPAARIGDTSRLRVGDWVVAIGNPLGLGISAKEGIVSRFEVQISVSAGQTLYDLIETSAAINPGNSGGPLVNLAGEVIGITSAKIAQVGVEGLGYAINVNSAVPIIEELVQVGCVIRPWLGVETFTVSRPLALRYRLPVDRGAIVIGVAPDSPASKSNIVDGDIVVNFGNQEINSTEDLIRAEHSSRIGDKVILSIYRASGRTTVEVTIAESPACKY